MRRINFLILSCLFLFLVSSCGQKDFLDATITTDLTEESVFTDSARTVAFLTDIYTNIGFSVTADRFSNGGLDACCDESDPQTSSSIKTTSLFATGTINAAIVTGDAWSTCYSDIRKVNQFLKHIGNAPILDMYKPTLIAEARFLRAWYYFILVQHYGGVPLVGDTIYNIDDHINMTRNTFEQSVNYILAECDTAAQVLSVTRVRQEYGRISKGACLALKSKVLLYAASPLYNGVELYGMSPYFNAFSTYSASEAYKKNLICYSQYDKERWRLAAEAADSVIKLNAYSLVTDTFNTDYNKTELCYGFYKVFVTRVNTEYILARMQGSNRELEIIWQPPTRGGGTGGFPYQELVDAFGMANGKSITAENSGYNPNSPYKNRDPRLDNTVLHDSSFFISKGGSQPEKLMFYLDKNGNGVTDDAVHAGTPTGYYVNKMIHRTVTANNVNGTNRCFPLIRYAEILLNYAEAENEYVGPTQSVYDAVEAIRQRAGLRPYKLDANLSQDQMRTIIHNERRLELAFEGHRFFDVRRWLEAASTQANTMTGMEVTRIGSQATFREFDVRKHGFRDAMYFWPIPQSEVAKSADLSLVQNPEW